MLYIVMKNSLGCEIDRRKSSEDTLDADMRAFVADTIFSVGDSIEIVDAD
jgi:hypothetical protein